MFSFGIIGFLAGLLFRRKRGKWKHFRVWTCLYGGLAALMIYGFLMDTSTVFMGMGAVHETAFLAAYLSGLPHEYHTWDCVRGISGYPGRADDAEAGPHKEKVRDTGALISRNRTTKTETGEMNGII